MLLALGLLACGIGMCCLGAARILSVSLRLRTPDIVRYERALLENESKTLNMNDGFHRARYKRINRALVRLAEEEAALSVHDARRVS